MGLVDQKVLVDLVDLVAKVAQLHLEDLVSLEVPVVREGHLVQEDLGGMVVQEAQEAQVAQVDPEFQLVLDSLAVQMVQEDQVGQVDPKVLVVLVVHKGH